MEVHHPHHLTHKKKWTEYLLEFFMLFLAVFLGFLAENQREHMVEHNREKQFINLLISDVKADMVKITEIIENRTLREARLDSLTFLINSDSASASTNDIYFFAINIARITIHQFTPSDGTMQQLKNSGGLRLIRSHVVADSIIKYDAAIRSLQRLDQQEQDIINIYREVGPKIFNGLELSKLSDTENIPLQMNTNPQLMPDDKNSLNEFNYRLVSVKGVNRG